MPPTSKLDLRKGFFGEGSVEVSPPKPGEGGVRRLAVTADRLLTEPRPDVKTVPDVLDYAAKTFDGDHRAVGWRDIVRIHEEKKMVKKVVDGEEREVPKTWSYYELTDPKYMTFTEYRAAAREVGRALVHLGIGEKDDVINIFAQTSVNWQLIAHGCQMISTAIATSYETLGPEGLTHSLNEPNCRGIFTNTDLLPTVLKVLDNTPSVQFVFYDGSPDSSSIDKIKSIRDGSVQAIHIDDLRKLGREQPESILEGRRPTPETSACIMYTSGTTGTPKGVHLNHGNLIASVAGVDFLYAHHIPVGTVYLAYLPLAHVLEYIVELCALYTGATAVYARFKTLSDSSVRNCKGDLTAFQPTVLFGVPAVWENIRKGILGKLDEKGWLLQKVVTTSLEAKKRGVPVLGWFADNFILQKLRQPTGGNVQWGINGGAAISKNTQEYISLSVMPLMQAYGMTESCGMCAILPPELHQYGVAGLPVPSVEIKFLDIPDMGYTSQNDPPQGEICIRGPSLTKGYYKRPDLNNDPNIFTPDGWLRTGDIGQWNKDGTLSVIDRLKNLIKLQNGEYIALEQLESVYKSCELISNLCIYASQDASQPIGIIVPHENNLRAALRNSPDSKLSSLASKPIGDLCHDDDVKKLVLKTCNELARKNKFKQAEMFLAVILSSEEWTPESGLVTAAQKVNRGAVSKKFKDEIAAAYGN
ncbi:acyl-CoA synthetase [Coprinopsis cinerea okayama7|uniref:Acyl-CoA synthetase n=1 Tax=Coprinopsis cinerea (strain Okayama-7 / 130 / ATCC MYA-4618 / FGSC 9003) TaxID=240176 RepID=A8PA78_COPC7|nr:acyl-CoA synthetase [Coprinopsis cinerea okayama7\|eukprot:XP_001839925.1 acyl-CoA synthetase [Coprinopsis cinerea okayama7\